MRKVGILCLLILLVGCESIIDFPETPDKHQYPVIEALLTNQAEIQKVRVSYTANLDDTLNSIPVSNGRVCVFSNVGDTFRYHHTEKGWYESTPFGALAGRTYTLKVELDTVSICASGSLISMNGIDSIYFRHTNNSNLYALYADGGSVNTASIQYYQLNIFRNDTLLTDGTNIAVFNDQYLTSLREVKLPFSYLTHDTVDVELLSISKSIFDYYMSISTNIFNLNFINSGYQINPPQLLGKNALGYFQVSVVNRKRIIINP